MPTATNRILSRLSRPAEDPRRALSILFKPENVDKLDAIARAMTRHSGTTTTRNMLIEDAVESFIEEAIAVFAEEGIALDIDDRDDFDTIVCPATMGEVYRRAFFEDREWRFVRIAKSKLEKIRYVALYVSAPQSSISHYAKVAGFAYDEEKRKYRILLDGAPIALERPILRGSATPMAVRSTKYTTLQKLLTASEFRELYEVEH